MCSEQMPPIKHAQEGMLIASNSEVLIFIGELIFYQ